MARNEIHNTRRYLAAFDTRSLPQMFTDCLVVGCGIAGLSAALEVIEFGQVTIITKGGLYESNTAQAQGGVAVVLRASEKDDLQLHMADTVKVGCGINDLEAVKIVINNGPDSVRQLIEWGAQFDSHDGEIDLGREAGHSANRVMHAQGDATGKEITRTLLERVQGCENIRLQENTFVIDLLTDDNKCLGAIVQTDSVGLQVVWAKQTILAGGGCGRVYQETTNPDVTTGDAMAMGWRARAVLQDMEMMQFHPTTLYIAGASRALISEAVRGEGGRLVDKDGKRFMLDYHEDAELAPRDVVSRAIMDYMRKTGTRYVYLDVRHIGYEAFAKRFPHITKMCESFSINVGKDLIPVRPSAHYMLGGIKADMEARTGIDNLYACGECACSGLHGANRLASNSLLEGLVFGHIAGRNAARWIVDHPEPMLSYTIESNGSSAPTERILDLQDARTSLRTMMWRHIAIERTGKRLQETIDAIDYWCEYILDKTFTGRFGWELQNMLTVSRLMAVSANQRTESRGVHYREDYPETDDKNWATHIEQCRTG